METTDIAQTGPYAHTPENITEVRFASRHDVDRSFTVLVADHAIADPEDEDKAGIAVLDNDNAQVVFDGFCGSSGARGTAIMFRFAHLCSMSWEDFSAACRNNPRYRGDINDIDSAQKEPDAGNLVRQAALGLSVSPEADSRSDFIRALSEDPDVPYKFPPSTRDSMVEEICRHFMFIESNGLSSHIAWDIRMNMNWNRTGRIKGEAPMNPDHDFNWRHNVEQEPEVIQAALSSAISPYTQRPSYILEMEQFPCEFSQVGKKGGFLVLRKFCDLHMSATRDVSMFDRLMRLKDDQLEWLWVTCRVLDQDLSREERMRTMEYEMHLQRKEFEEGARSDARAMSHS